MIPVIGNGVVIDIEVLFDELDALSSRGVDVSKLRVSANAHVITQYHRTLDKVTERFLGGVGDFQDELRAGMRQTLARIKVEAENM